MVIKEIQQFSEIRPKARAYLCYLLSRNIPNRTPEVTLNTITSALKKIKKEVNEIDAFYVLDSKGQQVINNISTNSSYRVGEGENRADRAYYYRAVREKRCILTDPYPSRIEGKLVVTAAYPVYNEKGVLQYVVCADIPLDKLLHMVHPSSGETAFGRFTKYCYAAFSVALFGVAVILFINGVKSFIVAEFNILHIDIKEMFEATILLTLSLAIFDLVKAIFEEEVLGQHRKGEADDIHKTMVRFLGSIIIALAIEALMLVFKFAIIDPEKLVYAVYLIAGVTMLLFGLSFYLKSIRKER
ncbi:PDC sensor domain-containing protein [Hydrogenimonas thermophila]|uniref:Cache domain-containing protein n=1 Tax=Hydrogenimonas thermophila TaxID=223786 RepID=A0A1I5M6K5_9BACT|nr:PDC sensor domain-containing protein [Hydrogenimonas thermophila]SFP05234.1 Cache domain-containing protein [Hydrogenimonas thermophila]